jgi:DNA-directed RNA polymerase specialized sigma24 family protein
MLPKRDNEREYWDWVEETVTDCAVACGFKPGDDDTEDCAQAFVVKKLQQQQDPVAEGATAAGRMAVLAQAHAHARHEYSLRKARRARSPSTDAPLYDKSGHRIELVSSEASPEAPPLEEELLDRLLAGAAGLSVERQRLWFRHVVEGERIVDLQEEFGKSANLLYKWLFTMRQIIREACEGAGLTEEELSTYRAELALLRRSP